MRCFWVALKNSSVQNGVCAVTRRTVLMLYVKVMLSQKFLRAFLATQQICKWKTFLLALLLLIDLGFMSLLTHSICHILRRIDERDKIKLIDLGLT